jgi:hypothetical protein
MIQDMMPLFSVFLSCGYSSWGGPSHCDARSRTVSTKKNFAVREAEAGDSRKTPVTIRLALSYPEPWSSCLYFAHPAL